MIGSRTRERGASRRTLAAFVVAGVIAWASPARAQIADQFSVERFRLAMDSAGILDVDWADVPGHTSWNLGLWVGFAHDPLVLYDRSMAEPSRAGALIEQRVTTGLGGSIALWNRLELGLSFDAIGYQASGGMVTASGDALPSSGAGDVRIAPKLLVLGGGRSSFHVALIPSATIPIGSARGFLREGAPAFAPELAVAFGGRGSVRIAGNFGYRMRERVEIADLVVDDEVFARLGAGITFGGRGDLSRAGLDVSTSIATPASGAASNQTALELMFGATVRISRSAQLFAIGGAGLDNGFGTPAWRAVAGVRVQALRGDRDGDLIADLEDACPDDAEDKDQFQDRDGCPELDNDNDLVADTKDKQPDVAEDRDGFEDDDGAPDLDDDRDGFADTVDKCPRDAEDKDGIRDEDGCPDPSGKVAGTIVDAEGRAIPAVALVIEQLDQPGSAPRQITGADDGTFTADVNAGNLKVTANISGYAPAEVTTKVGEGEAITVPLKLVRLQRQGQLRGQVQSFNGKPLAATIAITGREGTLKTDADGLFVIDLPEGSYQVVIEAKGHVTQRRSASVKVDRVTVLNTDMRRGK